jgi:glycosyltransferase involved in cell wall biosynthesis
MLVRSRVRLLRAPGPQFLLLSHTVDNTGAPLVLLEIAEELVRAHGPGCVRLIAPAVIAQQAERVRALGLEPERAAVLGTRISRFQLAAGGADFVLVNTAAIHDDYQRVLLDQLASGRLEHAFWFFHENVDQLPQLRSRVVEPKRLREMRRLIASGRLTVLVPSRKLKTQYDALFDTGDVRVIALHVVVDDRFCITRPAGDYHSLSFSIVGDASDSRKGQMLALAAFETFMASYFSQRPGGYRDFTLSLIGVRESENAAELKRRGEALLGDRFKIFPRMSPEAVRELTACRNTTICCAEHEGFPLYVAEAMAMGHVLLRNDTGGSEEQLVDGVNGFAITDDTRQFAAMIERLLNKETTSDHDLQAMGAASQQRVEPYRKSTYLAQLRRTSATVQSG